jgi:hypothetical protein
VRPTEAQPTPLDGHPVGLAFLGSIPAPGLDPGYRAKYVDLIPGI